MQRLAWISVLLLALLCLILVCQREAILVVVEHPPLPEEGAPESQEVETPWDGTAQGSELVLLLSPAGCIPRSDCCRICTHGEACGNACIQSRLHCHQPKGCACNARDLC